MELVEFVNTCDANTNLSRMVVSLKSDANCVSWKAKTGSDVSVEYTVDSETSVVDDVEQICLVNDGNAVDVFINYKVRFKLVKLDLETITSFSF